MDAAGRFEGGAHGLAPQRGNWAVGFTVTFPLLDQPILRARREIEAAGFKLAGEGNFLRNPADPRDRNTPEPPMPKDEVVLKFVKP